MDTATRTGPNRQVPWRPGQAGGLLFFANGIALAGLLVLLLAIPSGDHAVQLGTVAGQTVVARHKATYTDRAATRARKKLAMQGVAPVIIIDTGLAVKRQKQAESFLDATAPLLATSTPVPQKLSQIRKLLPSDISTDQLKLIATIRPSDYKVIRDQSRALIARVIDLHFQQNQIGATQIALLGTVSPHVASAQRAVIEEILATFITPTQIIDTPATLKLQHEKAAAVAPVVSTIYPGEVIVRRGDLVTPATMEKLGALGLQQSRAGWQEMLASLLFSTVIIVVLFWYLHAFHPELSSNPRLLLLIDASVLTAVAAARLVAPNHVLLPYFLPVAAAPTFAAMLIGSEAALAVALATAMLAGWVTASSFDLTTYYMLTSAAGVLAVRHVRQLKHFILAGAYITVFAFSTMLAFGLVEHTYDMGAIQDFGAAAACSGFLSSTLALGGFAVLSSYFGVTTTLQLLELAQPNQPLLRRLMVTAPGTYNHSLIVSSMVEHAAEEIGADSLVAKLGALYHDVGKTTNPHGFVENQLGMGNIHDELRPEESARLIRSHVTQGLRLARQYKLPRAVLDTISEHHGTMSIAYFLHRAREHAEEHVDVGLYTYPGPKPQSRETALVMLADGCESAVRASNDHSSHRIREIVNHIFAERVEGGQLNECPLTLRDLDLAREAFYSLLTGLYHPRVEYPETVELPVQLPERGFAG